MTPSKGGASEQADTPLLGKAGGTAAVRRTLAYTICQAPSPTQVPRPRQLRDVPPVMRFQPAHQSMINRRHNGRASCPAQYSPKRCLKESHEFVCLLLEKADMRVSRIRSSYAHWLDGDGAVAEPLDGGEDIIGGFGLAEGLGIGVAGIDVGGDGGLQFGG
jgi:hypothetical protein